MTTRQHRISRGFDLRLRGAASQALAPVPVPARVGVSTDEHLGVAWRVVVREGERVRSGEPVLTARDRGAVALVAPLTGRVAAITYGPRRAPAVVEIEPDASSDDAPALAPAPARLTDRAELAHALQRSGLWPLLRQRPFGRMARADRAPAAIFVNGMDTEPLAADPAVLVDGRDDEIQAGLEVLRRLGDGPTYLTLRAGARHPRALIAARGVEIHEFSGPHPSGLPGTHIDRIAPLRDGALYWTVRAQDVVRIGAWATSGQFPARRVVAVVGPAATACGYREVWQGGPLADIIGWAPPAVRVVQGTVLDGSVSMPGAYLGLRTHTITLLDDGASRRPLLGWAMPRPDRPSAARGTFSWLHGRQPYDVDARMHGSERAMIDLGLFAKVMPLEIHLGYLIRAIEAGDLDEAVALGLLDLTEEDVALCSVVDPCKIDFGAVIRRGLDRYEAEGGGA